MSTFGIDLVYVFQCDIHDMSLSKKRNNLLWNAFMPKLLTLDLVRYNHLWGFIENTIIKHSENSSLEYAKNMQKIIKLVAPDVNV